MKSLDTKLAEIRANRSWRAFVITDTKDADMALGATERVLHSRTKCARLPVV